MHPLWDNTLDSIRSTVGAHAYESWIRPIVCEEVTQDEIVLKVPDRFFRDWLQSHYLDVLEKAVRAQAARALAIRFTTEGLVTPPLEPVLPRSEAARKTATHSNALPLDPRYTFESFVVGPSNQFAHAAAEAVAETPGKAYNPLFVYGGVGLGKTHLLQAIGNRILATRPNAQVQYIASETYINDFVQAVRNGSTDEFRARYRRSCDVLLVDDVQFLGGKERTQVEFFHTFNSLYAEHKQIVVTSDRPPHEIADLEERLKNRFQFGLIADVQPPELETRVAILNTKAQREGIGLVEDVALYLAQFVKTNVRELEGMLVRLAAHARFSRSPIDLALARHVLKDLVQDSGPLLGIPQIQKVVAGHFNVTVTDLKGSRRHRAIAQPRMIAMYLARKHTRSSFPEIGKRFGNRDHSTVISAVNKIESLLRKDDHIRRAVTDLERSLLG